MEKKLEADPKRANSSVEVAIPGVSCFQARPRSVTEEDSAPKTVQYEPGENGCRTRRSHVLPFSCRAAQCHVLEEARGPASSGSKAFIKVPKVLLVNVQIEKSSRCVFRTQCLSRSKSSRTPRRLLSRTSRARRFDLFKPRTACAKTTSVPSSP